MGMFEKLFGRQRRVTEDNATVELPIPRGPALQVGNVQGVGARERQEDSFAVCNASDRSALEREGFFAVVCDGMGGMDSGNEASEAAVEAFLQLFHSLLAEGDIPRQLREGTLAVSDGIFQRFRGPQRHHGGGGADPGRRTPLDQRGGQRDLSQAGGVRVPAEPGADLPQRPLPAGAPAGAHPKGAGGGRRGRPPAHRLRRHRLPEQVDQSLRPWVLRDGDVILLCSDGISGVLSPAELREAMSLPPDEGCRLLETMVQEKALPGQDNYTGVMIAWKSERTGERGT